MSTAQQSTSRPPVMPDNHHTAGDYTKFGWKVSPRGDEARKLEKSCHFRHARGALLLRFHSLPPRAGRAVASSDFNPATTVGRLKRDRVHNFTILRFRDLYSSFLECRLTIDLLLTNLDLSMQKSVSLTVLYFLFLCVKFSAPGCLFFQQPFFLPPSSSMFPLSSPVLCSFLFLMQWCAFLVL